MNANQLSEKISLLLIEAIQKGVQVNQLDMAQIIGLLEIHKQEMVMAQNLMVRQQMAAQAGRIVAANGALPKFPPR